MIAFVFMRAVPDRQTDKQAGKQRDGQTGRQRDRQIRWAEGQQNKYLLTHCFRMC